MSVEQAMDTKALGEAVVEHVNADGDDKELWARHWSDSCVSVEGDGKVYEGIEALKAKYDWFFGAFTVHSCRASGPYVGPSGFAVHYEIDVEAKDGSMPRMQMQEVGVYTVENGKVVREEFWGKPMPGCEG